MTEAKNFAFSKPPKPLQLEAAATHTHSFANASLPCNGTYVICHLRRFTLTIAPRLLSLPFSGQACLIILRYLIPSYLQGIVSPVLRLRLVFVTTTHTHTYKEANRDFFFFFGKGMGMNTKSLLTTLLELELFMCIVS